MPTLAITAPRRRFAVGIAVSIVLHALVLTVLRPPTPVVAPDIRRWSSEVTIRLLPPPPEPMAKPAPEPEPVPQPERKRERAAEAPKKAPPPRKPPEAIYVQPAPNAAPDLVREPRPAEPAPETLRFDPEAAKAAARNIAASLDEPKSDAPNAQVNRVKRYRETKEQKLARDIKDSGRPDCKDGLPGGLLAPLYLMMEKKDSGCKW